MTDKTTQTKRQSTQQERAASAYPQVEAVSKASYKKEYKTLVRSFGPMIQIDGLGAALAFLKAKAGGKKDNAHAMLYEHLQAWLAVQNHTSGDLLQSVIALDSARYRHVAVEVQAYVLWLKRFAEALIEEDAKKPKTEEEAKG